MRTQIQGGDRMGVFNINDDVFTEFPEVVRHMQSLVTIVRCEFQYASRSFEYIGFSDLFEQVPEFIAAPRYCLMFDKPIEQTMFEPKVIAERCEIGTSFSQDPMEYPERFRLGWTQRKQEWEELRALAAGHNLPEDMVGMGTKNPEPPATASSAPESEPVNRDGLDKDIFDGRE